MTPAVLWVFNFKMALYTKVSRFYDPWSEYGNLNILFKTVFINGLGCTWVYH